MWYPGKTVLLGTVCSNEEKTMNNSQVQFYQKIILWT